jgi:hypothetical protein
MASAFYDTVFISPSWEEAQVFWHILFRLLIFLFISTLVLYLVAKLNSDRNLLPWKKGCGLAFMTLVFGFPTALSYYINVNLVNVGIKSVEELIKQTISFDFVVIATLIAGASFLTKINTILLYSTLFYLISALLCFMVLPFMIIPTIIICIIGYIRSIYLSDKRDWLSLCSIMYICKYRTVIILSSTICVIIVILQLLHIIYG